MASNKTNELLDPLRLKLVRQEFDFPSHIGLFGPLISKFRRLWNDVSTRWYVRHMAAQQHDFDSSMVSLLQHQIWQDQVIAQQVQDLEKTVRQSMHDIMILKTQIRTLEADLEFISHQFLTLTAINRGG